MGTLTLDPDNEIVLETKNGKCRIQLLSGDITTLPIEDKVDIIMVSAFPGDYAPMAGTVIGALKNKLDISVRDLAYTKELDLRHHFSCWMSREITRPNSPYKKLLCFEKLKSNMSLVEQVSQMFRVFVPVFNNQDNSVITPLLATGHQQQSEAEVCKTMVKAGAYWINAGLPLRLLKIVVYGQIRKEILQVFQKVKKKLLKENQALKKQITHKTYDVYVSYHPHDEKQYVAHIVSSLKKQNSEIKLFASVIEYDHKTVWQKNIFNAMVSSKRIIVVLTALFLESSECLEQYNMAMCCNKIMDGDIMAPFYVENIKSLPSYMTLVQWIDCRERKEGDNTIQKIAGACSTVLKTLADSETNDITELTKLADTDKYSYDVFISYSHKNPKEAELLLNKFKEVDKTVKVFYDRSVLTTGSNWQKMLYDCMGGCKCAIALLSPNYLISKVCMEEYNLALARFLSQDKNMKFLPIWIEHSDMVPVQISGVDILDAVGKFEGQAHDVAQFVTNWLKNPDEIAESNLFPDILPEFRSNENGRLEDDTLMEKLLSEHRTSKIDSQYKLQTQRKGMKEFTRTKPLEIKEAAEKLTGRPLEVVVSFSNDSSSLANIFCSLMDLKCLNVSINKDMHATLERMAALDKANIIVVFVSKEYLITESHMHELHLALSRQRSCDTKIIYLIKTKPLKDVSLFFPRILPYDVSTTDSIWKKYEKEYLGPMSSENNWKTVVAGNKVAGNTNYTTCSHSEFFALTKASDDVTEILLNLRDNTITHKPMLLNLISVELEVMGKSRSANKTQLEVEFSKTSHSLSIGDNSAGETNPKITNDDKNNSQREIDKHDSKLENNQAKKVEHNQEKEVAKESTEARENIKESKCSDSIKKEESLAKNSPEKMDSTGTNDTQKPKDIKINQQSNNKEGEEKLKNIDQAEMGNLKHEDNTGLNKEDNLKTELKLEVENNSKPKGSSRACVLI